MVTSSHCSLLSSKPTKSNTIQRVLASDEFVILHSLLIYSRHQRNSISNKVKTYLFVKSGFILGIDPSFNSISVDYDGCLSWVSLKSRLQSKDLGVETLLRRWIQKGRVKEQGKGKKRWWCVGMPVTTTDTKCSILRGHLWWNRVEKALNCPTRSWRWTMLTSFIPFISLPGLGLPQVHSIPGTSFRACAGLVPTIQGYPID